MGAFAEAVAGIEACVNAGLYTAAQAVVEPALLADDNLQRFIAFCQTLKVHDIMLLEPLPVRGAASCTVLSAEQREKLGAEHRRSLANSRRPKVSAMPFLESPEFLGCQAGYSFIYVTAAGDAWPCDLAPLSFGNVCTDGLGEVLRRMNAHFPSPCRRCLGMRLDHLGFAARPGNWDQTSAVLQKFAPGDASELMKMILPKG